MGAVSLQLFSVFPAPRPRFHRPFVLALSYGVAAVALTIVQVKLADPAFAAVSSQLPAGYLAVCFALDVLMLSATIRAGPSDAIRNKARTILVGLILTAAAGVVFGLLVRNYPELITAERAMMLSALFPVLLAYAVIKKNLFDMEFVLRTTAIYAVATALVLGLYFAVVFFIGTAASLLTRRYAGPASVTGAVLSTLLVALVFHPLRLRVQRLVDRYFFREKGELQHALVKLVNDLSAEAPALPDLSQRLTRQVRRLMRCRFVALLCPDPRGGDLRVAGVGGEAPPGVASLVIPRDAVDPRPVTARADSTQCWIEEGQGIPSFYLAHSLSHDGLMLRAKHPPRAGLPMSMRLIVENEPRVMSVQGEVVNTDSGNSSFAVRFLDLDDDELAFLEDLIEETAEA